MNKKLFSGSLLILGTAVGAGMLGIPLVTAQAGFFSALFFSAFVALFMCLTGLLFLEAIFWTKNEANLMTISQVFLGPFGKVLASGSFLFLYYCLLSAYFSAAAPLIGELVWAFTGFSIAKSVSSFFFLLFFGSIVVCGMYWVNWFNTLSVFVMVGSYFALVFFGSLTISLERLQRMDFLEGVWSMPILFSAFGYHNVIPSLTAYFLRDKVIMQKVIILGSFLVFVVYALWQYLILGAIPLEVLQQGASIDNAFHYLQKSGPIIAYFSAIFGFFAIVTSFFGVSFSMIDFLGDALGKKRSGKDRWILAILTFIPPFLIANTNPQIFIQALELAGGVGEAILNGILPVLFVWVGISYRKKICQLKFFESRLLLGALLFAGLGVFFLEVYVLFMKSGLF